MNEWPYMSIIAILCLFFFSSVILSTNSVMHSNASDINYFYSNFIFLKDSISNELPLWNPLLMGGFPWFGNPESGLFYPFTLIFTILFPPHLTINYLIIFNVILTGIFMHLYLRELKVPSNFSLFGAITFMFSGFTIARIYAGHISILNSLPWIPLIFLLIEKTVKTKPITASILLGIVFGLQLLGSQPQIVIYILIASAFYFAFRHISKKTGFLNTLKIATVTAIFFVGISAIQLLPSYELLKLSVRSEGLPYEQLTGSSLPPVQLISLVLPEFFGTALDYTTWGESNFWELTGYAGLLTIVFAGISLYIKPGKLTFFFLLLAIFSILYSFGKFNPFFSIIQDIPLLNVFRVPSRFLLFFDFSVSVMASIGLAKFFNFPTSLKRFAKLAFITGILILITIVISAAYKSDILAYAQGLAEQRLKDVAVSNPISSTVQTLLETKGIEYFTNNIFNHILANLTMVAVSLFGFTFVYLLLLKGIVGNRMALIFIIALLLLDLWSFGAKYISTAQIFVVDLLQLPKETYNYRIISSPDAYLVDQTGLAKKSIQRFDGYYVAKLSHYNDVFEASKSNRKLLEIGNVNYAFNGNGTFDSLKSLPRAFFVYSDGAIPNKLSQLDVMDLEEFDPEKQLPIDNSIISIKSIEQLNIISYKPNEVTIDVNNSDKGYVVLLDTWYPGWKAYVDGNEKEVLRAYHMMRGIEITENVTSIKFSFEPKTFQTGFIITTITFISIITLCLLSISNNKLKRFG